MILLLLGCAPPLVTLAPPAALADLLPVLGAEEGLEWELDTDFLIADHDVPQVVPRPGGGWQMYVTSLFDPEGRYVLSSEDGLNWTIPDTPRFLPDDFPVDCGNRLEDAAVRYHEDGSRVLVLEGSLLDESTDLTAWRRWCQALAADGEDYEPVDGYFFTGGPTDHDTPSVPAFLPRSDWSSMLYYVGDIYQVADSMGIRVGQLPADDDEIDIVEDAPVLDGWAVDPMPVHLEGGGVRLYYTRGEAGDIAFADSEDGRSFEDHGVVLTSEGDCRLPGGECFMDPAVFRLDDGRLVMYFTLARYEEPTVMWGNIGRAFAVP